MHTRTFLRRGGAIAVCVLTWTFGAACRGGPTDAAPKAMLPIRQDQASVPLLADAAALYAAAEEEVARHEENHASKRYEKASKRDMERISATSLKLLQLSRLARRLSLQGELAGVDLQFRQRDLQSRLAVVIAAYQKSDGAATLIAQSRKTLESLSVRDRRSIPRITALLERDKLETADKELDAIFEDLHRLAVFVPRNVSDPNLGPFVRLRNAVDDKLNQQRAAAMAERLKSKRESELPNYEAIEKLLAGAVASVADSGHAAWAGETLDGPALMAAWGAGWQTTQRKMLSCYALDRLRKVAAGATPPSELDRLLAAHEKFEQAMLDAMVHLVQADAGRATAAQTPALYTRYLQAIAQICARAADDRVAKTLQPALHELANRSPEFARQVAAYDAATREALRWRSRMAAAYARRHMRDAVALDELFDKASTPEAMKHRRDVKPTVIQLVTAAPPLVEDVAAVAVGQDVYALHVASASGQRAASRLQDHWYAQIARVQIPDSEIAALKSDLLVTDEQPPLTLAAAIAIESAESGIVPAVGGEVIGVELGGLLPQLADDDDESANYPIGAAPDVSRSTLEDTLWHVEVKPKWIQHEYIFSTAP